MQRFLSIDFMRGLAILLMIQVHFVENLSSWDSDSGWLFDVSVFLGTFPAPFFTFVAGASYCLWVRKQESASMRDRDITRITLYRGAFLFAVGIAFNFLIWLPEETFNWDILTLIGTAFLVLAVVRKLPAPVLTLGCAMILLLSPLARVVGDYYTYWEDDAYTYDYNARDVIFGFVANGYFPVFPWIVFPIAGFLSGDQIYLRQGRRSVSPRWTGGIGIGLLALAGAGIVFGSQMPRLISQYYANGLTEFPASTEYVFAMLGIVLLSALTLHRLLDEKSESAPEPGPVLTVIARYSAFSLTVYVFHHMVILWPLWIYGAWMGHDDPTYYWREAISTPLALALAGGFLAVCHFILLFLESNKKYSLEALMRRMCG